MAKERIKCDQCELLSINGVACHKTGCPNSRAGYDTASGEWIKQRKCFECGCTVDADDPCCSTPAEEEDVATWEDSQSVTNSEEEDITI